MARKPPRPEQQGLARERVRLLFTRAANIRDAEQRAGQRLAGAFGPRPGTGAEQRAGRERAGESQRLVLLARRVAMRSAIKIPAPWNRSFCRRCSSLLGPGTARVRTSARQRAVLVACLRCGAVRRRPYRRERSA